MCIRDRVIEDKKEQDNQNLDEPLILTKPIEEPKKNLNLSPFKKPMRMILKFIVNKRLLKTSGKIFIESPKTMHTIEMKNFKVIKEKIVGDVKGQLIKWK